MWSQLPFASVLASIFLCCGCVAVAWIRMHKFAKEVERLEQEFALRTQEQDDAYVRLEARVEDLAARLARSTAERRELSGAHQRVAADNQALAMELQGALEKSMSLEGEFARAPAREPESTDGLFEAARFEQVAQTIAALAAGLGEEQPLPPVAVAEVAVAQEEGIVMPDWFENETRPITPESVPSLSVSAREAEAESAAAARVAGLERRLDAWDEQLQRHVATIASLQDAAVVQGGQMEAVRQRCVELERQVREFAARPVERPQEAPKAESTRSAREVELEERLASRDDELRQRAEEIESLQVEKVASQRQLDAAGRRCAELEQRIQQQAQEQVQEAQVRLVRDQEQRQASTDSVRELEALLASRDEDLRQRAGMIELLQDGVVAKARELEAADRRCAELEQGMRLLAQEEQGRSARHDEELRQRATKIERLESEVAARSRVAESAGERCSDLEQQLRRQEERVQERDQQRDELEQQLRKQNEREQERSQRCDELEQQLRRQNEREQERSQRCDELEQQLRRQSEREQERSQRCDELEQQLRRQEEREQEGHRREQELQRALSARAGDLEERLLSLDEDMNRRSTTIERLQGEMAAKDEAIAGLGERCAQLEQQIARQAEQEQGREASERSAASERLLRTRELETELATRDQDMRRLSSEHAQLSDRFKVQSEQLEQRFRELRERDAQIHVVHARAEAVDASAERGREELRGSEAVLDELVENRITTLFKRRTGSSSEALPELYLDGLEQGDFDLALQGLLGDPEPLATPSVARLGARWKREHEAWRTSRLDREVVYLWADGVRLRAGLENEETALLVVVASHVDGSRSVVAVESGDPKSKEVWLGVLRNLVQRGMNVPRLVVASGSSGLWSGIDELGWDSARQYCWSHKTADVLAALPKKRQSQAGKMLLAASSAVTRVAAKKLRDRFVKRCGVRCAGAGEQVTADWKQMTSFYAFPEDHWAQLRTTGVIESPLAAIHLCASEPKASKPSPNVEAVLWKLLCAATKTARKLSGPKLLLPGTGRRGRREGGPGERSRSRVA
ncbi:MAG TPA: transposase [Planctomycetota bacterium]|jgi:transposase-like protein|nr:transposase [Planctomycetota bacterium]